MKIALLLLRGVEGAGVSRYGIELDSFLNKQSIEHKFFVATDKKWGRSAAQNFPPYEAVNKDNIKDYITILNTFDYVFINSVPSTKHPQELIDGFLQLVKEINKPIKIIFQNDHKIASIHRNANFFELCNLCDGIVSHSITSPFYKKLVSIYGEEIKSKFIQLHVGFDFSQLQKFRKENHYKKITYLGRYATFKQPDRLFGFLPYAKENNLLLECKGVERSLGALNMFYDDIKNKIPKHDIIEINKKSLEKGLILDNDKRSLEHIYIAGPYQYNDGMETLSSSLVGADFYHLDATAYGDNFEYAQCEIIGVGTIPMFDYHWAENCYIYNNGKKTNQKFIELDNYGLFVKKDLSNVEEIVEKINEIYNDKNLKNKYLECSYEITENHCNSKWIFENLLNDITKLNKHKIITTKKLF